jgi:hypothetical protein
VQLFIAANALAGDPKGIPKGPAEVTLDSRLIENQPHAGTEAVHHSLQLTYCLFAHAWSMAAFDFRFNHMASVGRVYRRTLRSRTLSKPRLISVKRASIIGSNSQSVKM